MKRWLATTVLAGALSAGAAESPLDGRPWNISTGNLSVGVIQASPIGAYPRPGAKEDPPSDDTLARLKSEGLVAYEDYVAWGAVEVGDGTWNWEQHDAIEKAMHRAGLKYVVYNWVEFPPVWLRERPASRTLMRCCEHGNETFYLSIFDPKTLEWYDHFYKNLHHHFGDKIDGVYACVLGPYGEGNYPIEVKDWVNMGHCHEGYWCADEFARRAFRRAMREAYHSIDKLNTAWGAQYKSFDDVALPEELFAEKFVPSPSVFTTGAARRRWLDFIGWYHQSIIDFAGESLKVVRRYFPAAAIRLKPGGTCGGVNPLPWGTYCPGYAKMARGLGVALQPADCMGAVFGDKWVGTAYQFYGVTEGTEPAGVLSSNAFVRRMFSDASCGAAQFFGYQFEEHAANMRRYVGLFSGKPGETQVAVYGPTTVYRLGGSLAPVISAADALRDLCEFDVLDEQLIRDGALDPARYKALLVLQGDIIDRPVLEKLDAYQTAGGRIIMAGGVEPADVEGRQWVAAQPVIRINPVRGSDTWRHDLLPLLSGLKGVDGHLDGLWTCRRAGRMFVYNSTSKPVSAVLDGQSVTVDGYSIWIQPTK